MSKFELKCENCCYQWKEEWEDYPSCHWEARCPDDKALCEYDDSDYYGDDGDEEFEEDLEWALREQREWESIEEWYRPSSSARDYGPGNPWDAPGMSMSDFF